jgi:CubicO group peptidase (beta-lactamase class C family)
MIIEGVARLVAERANAGEFSGVVLLRRDGVDLFADARGWAVRGHRVPNRVDTRFRIGSVSKAFTAVAVAQLVEARQLAYDTQVVGLLGLAGSAIPAEVTVAHLLTMTAGIADWFDESDDADAVWDRLRRAVPIYLLRDNADYLPLFVDLPPVAPVGARHAYSNASYILLGALIEAASGQSYSEYVSAHIFEAIAMADSGFEAIDDDAERVAEGYLPVRDNDGMVAGWRRNVYAVTPTGAADGGATSTAADLSRFMHALRTGQLVSPEATRRLLTPQVVERDEPVRGYRWRYGDGLYFLLDDADQVVRYGLPGEEEGVSCRLFHYPRQGIDVTILGNQSGCAQRLGWDIHDLIVAATPPIA